MQEGAKACLSNLQNYKNNLLFVESKCDMDTNNYHQWLHTYSLNSKEDKVLLDDKRTPFFALKDKVLVVKNDEDKIRVLKKTNSYLYDENSFNECKNKILKLYFYLV